MAKSKTPPKSKAAQVPKDKALATETGADMPPVRRWIKEIETAKKAQADWQKKADQIVKRYKDIRGAEDKDTGRKYNALWSLMQTLMPLTYATPPKPYVSRRYNDNDPVARDASGILQRALTYCVDADGVHDALDEANEDFNLVSRGVTWDRYSPLFALRETDDKTYIKDGVEPPDGAELKEDDEGTFFTAFEEKIDEDLVSEHVLYSDFLHGTAAKWTQVPWVARRVPMTRARMMKRFKAKGKFPPLTVDCTDPTKKDVPDTDKGLFAKAEIWELWDKEARKVYWICPDYSDDFLDEQDDPLELVDFFPCPRPAYGTKTNDSLIPQPDYLLWQDIAIELDDVTQRLKLLTEALRVVGVYDRSASESLGRLLKQTSENDMVPVDSWAMFQEKGGLKGAVEFLPIEPIMVVIDKLSVRRASLVQELYEITGVSDIIRGASDPGETATAQTLKGNYANKRLGKRQDRMARMAREGLDIKAQIICKHYSDDKLREISSAEQFITNANNQFDVQRFNAAVALLRSGVTRCFRIKIDERSLAEGDIKDERDERIALLQSVSQFLGPALQMVQQWPESKRMMAELLMFGVRAFPLARSTEATMEAALDQLVQSQPQPQDNGKAAPAGKSQGEVQAELMKAQAAMMRAQAETAAVREEMENNKRHFALKMRELEVTATDSERDASIRLHKIGQDATLRAAQNDTQLRQVENQANFSRAGLHLDAVKAFTAPKPQRAA